MKRASCAVRQDQTGESIRFIALPKHSREAALWRLRSSNYREISALNTIEVSVWNCLAWVKDIQSTLDVKVDFSGEVKGSARE